MQLQLSHMSDTCSQQLTQHFPITETAHQEQTLELFRSVYSVDISITIQQNQSYKNPLGNGS